MQKFHHKILKNIAQVTMVDADFNECKVNWSTCWVNKYWEGVAWIPDTGAHLFIYLFRIRDGVWDEIRCILNLVNLVLVCIQCLDWMYLLI